MIDAPTSLEAAEAYRAFLASGIEHAEGDIFLVEGFR